MLEAGAQAPNFTAQDHQEETVSLSDLKGSPVVLYFYPRNNTPGCTREAKEFRDRHAEFQEKGAVVLGVSPDSVTSHGRFRDKHELPFRLLSDEDNSLAEAYGVWQEKKAFGRVFWGVVRTTFVIDAHGQIKSVIRNVKPEQHVAKAIEALNEE